MINEVQVNHRRLQDCRGPHSFEHIKGELNGKYRCSKCFGVVDSHAYYWYVRGLQHGLGSKVDDSG